MEIIASLDTVDETPGCACLQWGTDNEVDHSMRQALGLWRRGIKKQWSDVD